MSFTRFAPTDFVISSDSVTAPAWSTNLTVLTPGNFNVAPPLPSTTITAGAFYLNVYQLPIGTNGSAVQFAIAYGNINGSGSILYNQLVPGVSPSLSTYKQYKTLIYGPELSGSQGFNFGGASTQAPEIYALNVERNRYKGSLFPGTFNLQLTGPTGTKIQLCDDSRDTTVVSYLDCGRVFNIVSGSYGNAAATAAANQIAPGYTASGSYGLFLPDIGTIILNVGALKLSAVSGGIAFQNDTRNYGVVSFNASASYTSTNNTVLYNALNTAGYFQLNSEETISSDYVFVRVANGDYNYSSNPSFTSGSGNVLFDTMVFSPQTYITTIGMYNDNTELLAVAKLSKPLVKDFTKEALIRVKLDW